MFVGLAACEAQYLYLYKVLQHQFTECPAMYGNNMQEIGSRNIRTCSSAATSKMEYVELTAQHAYVTTECISHVCRCWVHRAIAGSFEVGFGSTYSHAYADCKG